MEQSYVDGYCALQGQIKLLRMAENDKLIVTFDRMWNATNEKEADDVITIFAVLEANVMDDEKETLAMEEDIERDDVAKRFELETNE